MMASDVHKDSLSRKLKEKTQELVDTLLEELDTLRLVDSCGPWFAALTLFQQKDPMG